MIVGLVIAAVLIVVLFLAWRYDRRHGRHRVGDRSAAMDVGLAETRFQSQNTQGGPGI